MRNSEEFRQTAETSITVKLNIDGVGESDIDTGCGFLDHMLNLFSKHGRFNLYVRCVGDTNVDYHHTVEDIGIVLGTAFSKALGDKRGINRYGCMILPMDESLVMSSVDFSGRSCLNYQLNISTEKVGDFDTELVEEFWLGFVRNANMNLHIIKLMGKNSHHIIEGAFKSVARSIRTAVSYDARFADEIPSTKGVL